jgi:hypothetical protein
MGMNRIALLRHIVCVTAYGASLLALWFIPTTQIIHFGATPDSETYSLAQIDSQFLRTASPARGILWETILWRFVCIWATFAIAWTVLSAVQRKAARQKSGEPSGLSQ